jgi:predicted NACHT family NTPase
VGSAYSNYGHNIEAAWLLADGVDELQAKGAIDTSKAAAMRKALQEIGEAAIVAGYDEKNGGM